MQDHSFTTIKFMINFILNHVETPAKGDTIDWKVRKACKQAEGNWNYRKYGKLCEGCWVEAVHYVYSCDDMKDIRQLKKACRSPSWGS